MPTAPCQLLLRILILTHFIADKDRPTPSSKKRRSPFQRGSANINTFQKLRKYYSAAYCEGCKVSPLTDRDNATSRAAPSGGVGLRGVKMTVPHAVRLGAPALLSCQYLLDGDALYSVKWYKGGREFYRYTPKETPALKVFPMPGLTEHDIKKEESNATQVSLREVSGSMAGSYSCEVSADAPSFHTVVVSAHLEVVESPSGQPVIRGLRPRYRLGDWIYANCTTPGSKPAANVTWTVNGQHVPKDAVRQYREVDRSDLEVSVATLRLLARSQLFPDGRLKVKCIASIFSVYWQTTEKAVELEARGGGKGRHENEVYDREPDYIPGGGQEFLEQGSEKNSSNSARTWKLNTIFTICYSANLVIRFITIQV